jgi:hypothetical protein
LYAASCHVKTYTNSIPECNVKNCDISEWEVAGRNDSLFAPDNLLGVIIGRGLLGHLVLDRSEKQPDAVETLLKYVGEDGFCIACNGINVRWIVRKQE